MDILPVENEATGPLDQAYGVRRSAGAALARAPVGSGIQHRALSMTKNASDRYAASLPCIGRAGVRWRGKKSVY